jgi:hypothetical protein
MRSIRIFLLLWIGISVQCVRAQKNSGIFYSTLHSKEGIYKRTKDFGDRDDYLFLKDINGDGRDDAVVVVNSGPDHGAVLVSLSDGTVFTPPRNMFTYRYQQGFVYPVTGDIDGDGKHDLVYVNPVFNEISVAFSTGNAFSEVVRWSIPYQKELFREIRLADINGDRKDDILFPQPSGNDSIQWFSCISRGDGTFAVPERIFENSGPAAGIWLVGDLNGDRQTDLVSYQAKKGICRVNLSPNFQKSTVWLSGIDKEGLIPFIYDVDRDGKDDLILWDKPGDCDWRVAYSDGKQFSTPEVWITDHRKAKFKDNVPPPDRGLTGTLDGKVSLAMVVSDGKWLGVDYPGKGKTANSLIIDSWEARGFDLVPTGGTYNTGDPGVNRKHIRMIADAGFTYVTLDITNGSQARIDNRALKFMESVREWNSELKAGKPKLYFNIALGNTRGTKNEDEFFRKLNEECKRAWEAFYLPYADLYYGLNDKPLLIHMLVSPGLQYVEKLNDWKGKRDYIDRFTNRWMAGEGDGACCERTNFYGWKIPSDNLFHEEMMPVMPGFKNPSRFFPRNNGDYYRRHWVRVLEYQPASVWVNSFNDVEYTGVEPARLVVDQFVSHPDFREPWTDEYGNPTDDFYWIITYRYNHLFMFNKLLVGTYFREVGGDTIYEVRQDGWAVYPATPVKAPVLLFPEGFRERFNGTIEPDSITR